MDAIAIPILVKAIDWLFGEGSKILQERRERRASNTVTEAGSSEIQPSSPAHSSGNINIIHSKEDALSQRVLDTAWKDSQARVEHLLSLLDIYTKNYYLAKEQYAQWGKALVPPIILHNLTEAEDNISSIAKELQRVLNQAYAKRLNIPGMQ